MNLSQLRTNMKHPLILTALLLALLAALHAAEPAPLQPPAASVTVSDLRCGGQVEPLGIDDEELLLGWQIKGDTRGLRQTAYRVLAASSPDLLADGKADLWDSGKIESDQSQYPSRRGSRPGCLILPIGRRSGSKAIRPPCPMRQLTCGRTSSLVFRSRSFNRRFPSGRRSSAKPWER